MRSIFYYYLPTFLLQEHAFESSQKYKEGKFIIEMAHMLKENGWEWIIERMMSLMFRLYWRQYDAQSH